MSILGAPVRHPEEAQLHPIAYLTDGTPVMPETAIEFTAVFAVVRVISGNLAGLSFITYKRLKDRGWTGPQHPSYHLPKNNPNQIKTSGLEIREMLASQMLLCGERVTDAWWGMGRRRYTTHCLAEK